MLTVQDLSIRFETRDGPVDAVTHASLEISDGERLALVGESGCGKTVLALALLGLLPRNARVGGRVEFDGADLTDSRVAAGFRGRSIVMCWSNAERYFNPVMRIGRQIEEAYSIHRDGDSRSRTLDVLRQVGFDEPEQICMAYPSQLSGGMNQRAMIAMSLIHKPRLLLVDEPTRGLDDANRDRVVNALRGLNGVAMLIITHDIGLVEQLAHAVHFMRAGEIIDGGRCPEALLNPGHPYSRELVRASV
jgi:ABC-type dipeptide/oligopeptide/nickel transport system ATPase component